MISKAHDENGKILGYIEYWQVGKSGFPKPYGEYVWIQDFWIHEANRGGSIFAQLVDDVLKRSVGAKFTYFIRGKYKDRISKLYTREQFQTLVEKRGITHGK